MRACFASGESTELCRLSITPPLRVYTAAVNLHRRSGNSWYRFIGLFVLRIRTFSRYTPKPPTGMATKSNESLPTRKGVYLQEIDLNRTEADTDIDIIAIHGLDTKSPDTWTWKDPRDPNNKRKWVNWLGPGMLPTSVDRVRIFTCDWPADLLVPSDLIQKTIEEKATRGIIFLATPFRGTSFQDVAAWAEVGLKAKASTQDRNPAEGWSLESLFHHEYFKKGGEDEGRRLAKVLSQALLGPNAGRTLFILDGLDEVAGAWGYNDYRSEVLLELLNQPAVIITSRPSAILPAGVHKTDFEVETIGFCLDQVAYYIRKTFTEREKADEIWLFLQAHWLLEGLVRIPIQLDALCYIWDDLELDDIPNTMTGIYEEIELKLWKKDVVRLEKRHDDKMLLVCDLQTVDRSNIERFAKDEMFFLEGLAFTGLHNDVIDFTSKNLKDISSRFTPDLLPNKSLPLLSFLRTSDPLSEYDNQEYHFIHLTFQEYFAARYFARQWKDEGQLQIFTLGSNNAETRSRPKEFLREQKYTARYNIFWRFVAGLLDASGQSSELIRTIEEEPLDLLGFTHQRLVMYCLSETLGDLPLRKTLEERLAQWLLFECQLNETATETLASEMEFPEEALKTILLNKSHNAHATILTSLASRVTISPSIARVAMAYMSNNRLSLRMAAIRSLRTSSALPDEVLKAMAARLGDKKKAVRLVARDALSKRTALSDEVLKAIAAWLNDNDPSIRCAATTALHTHAALPDEVIEVVAERLNDKDLDVKKAAIMALSIHEALPNDTIRAITANLSDNNPDVRQEAVEVLGKCVTLPVEVYDAVMARCHDENPRVQRAAVAASSRYQALSDEVFCNMFAQTLNQDLDVRGAGVEAFSRYIVPPDDVIRAAAKRPTDPSRLTIVMSCKMLPENFIWPAMMWFGDEEAAMRLAATGAISMPPSERAELLIDLVPKVFGTFPKVRKAVREHYSRFVELPDEVLKAARLYDESEEAREAAVETLMKLSNEDLPRIISTQPLVTSFYKACLWSGFKELISWYIEKDRCYMNWPGGIGQIFPDIREHQIREWISQARPAGFPSIRSGENLPEV
ncbi:hypothetical protein MY4824_000024 [Beauveria thailandica]